MVTSWIDARIVTEKPSKVDGLTTISMEKNYVAKW